MNLAVLRVLVATVCVVGIAGMIIGSIADNNNGIVITFGLVTAVSVLVLMAVSAASRGSANRSTPSEELAARVEDQIGDLVAGGADEQAVRTLVGDAVRLGRGG